MAYNNSCYDAAPAVCSSNKLSTSPIKVSQMDDVESRLIATIDRLCNEVEILESRLYRVLDMSSVDEKAQYSEPNSSRLDNSIYRQSTRINAVADRISAIREGLIL